MRLVISALAMVPLLCGMIADASPLPRQTTQAPPVDNGDIVVTGISKPYRLTVAQLRAAQQAFDKGRASLAPRASLWFAVSAVKPGGTLDGVALTLRGEGRAIPVSIGADHRFVLPNLPKGDWQLVSNRSRQGLSIHPLVFSPGSDDGDRRLGDLRLQCRVMWAIEKRHASIVVVGLFEAAGACSSSRIAIYENTDRAIATAELREGDAAKPVDVLPNRHVFRMPLSEKRFSNEARLRLGFAPRVTPL